MEINSLKVRELAKVLEPSYLTKLNSLKEVEEKIKALQFNISANEVLKLEIRMITLKEGIQEIETKVEQALRAIEDSF